MSFSGVDFKFNLNRSDSECNGFVFDLLYVNDVSLTDVVMNSCGGGLLLNGGHNILISHMTNYYSNHSGVHLINTTGSIGIENASFSGPSTALYIFYDNTNMSCFLTNELRIRFSTFSDVASGLLVYLQGTSGCLNISVLQSTFQKLEGFGFQVFLDSPELSLDVQLNSTTSEEGNGTAMIFYYKGYRNVHSSIYNCSFKHFEQGGVVLYPNDKSIINLQNLHFERNNVLDKFKITDVPATALTVWCSLKCSTAGLITVKNVTFLNNGNTPLIGVGDYEVPTVYFFEINVLIITDCFFINNTGTALRSVNSRFSVNGTLNFTGNIAYEGAAMYFQGLSSMTLVANGTIVNFITNYASHTGGAIKVSNNLFSPTLSPLCFLSVRNYTNGRLNFVNNTARYGGDAIYGGGLDQAQGTQEYQYCIEVIKAYSDFSTLINSNTSLISSDPSRVCLCQDNRPLCLKYSRYVMIPPGKIFHLSAYVVGQHFGTAKGTVYAQFLTNSNNASISPLEVAQNVDQYYCNQTHNVLSYTFKTSQGNSDDMLVLTAQDVTVPNLFDFGAIEYAVQTYHKYNGAYVPQILLQIPVYVHIKAKECPPGFSFSKQNKICVCNEALRKLSASFHVVCDIQTERIQRSGNLWISASAGVLEYSKYCRPLFCKTEPVQVNLSSFIEINKQCMSGHSDILCSRCKNDFSLAIGSSRCLPHCSNNHLSLLLVFAIAGVLLVLLIKYLNLTVTQGALNGLIFYANIVQTTNSAFLASNQIGVRVFAVFIAWLNLDFGIETCFSRGLDMYTKTWLQFIFPLYIWTLAGGIILVCRFSVRATRFFGNNTVQVLATLFLLSYNKLLRTITVVFSFANKVRVNVCDNHESSETVWAYDGTIPYYSPPYAILLAVSAAMFVFLWLPFTFFVLFGQWLQRYNHHRVLRWVGRMRPLLEAYYGPLKDRHRYWVGVLLLARVVVIIPAADPFSTSSVTSLTVAILSGALLFFTSSVGGMYKKNYISVLENSFFLNLLIFSALLSYLHYVGGDPAVAEYVKIGLAFAAFTAIIIFQVSFVIIRNVKQRNYHALDYEEVRSSINDVREELS